MLAAPELQMVEHVALLSGQIIAWHYGADRLWIVTSGHQTSGCRWNFLTYGWNPWPQDSDDIYVIGPPGVARPRCRIAEIVAKYAKYNGA
jgi:hypothetical protein